LVSRKSVLASDRGCEMGVRIVTWERVREVFRGAVTGSFQMYKVLPNGPKHIGIESAPYPGFKGLTFVTISLRLTVDLQDKRRVAPEHGKITAFQHTEFLNETTFNNSNVFWPEYHHHSLAILRRWKSFDQPRDVTPEVCAFASLALFATPPLFQP
jgi:hypothetical protein